MFSYRSQLVATLVAIWTFVAMSGDSVQGEGNEKQSSPFDFEQDIRSVFAVKCLQCHSADEPEGDLNLTVREFAVEGGQIVPGKPTESSLIERITSTDESLRMPPEGEPLSPSEVKKISAWIQSGAPWPRHWAYQKLIEPELPNLLSTISSDWCQTPIDVFIAARLEKAGLVPSAVADRTTLIRRATIDLTGLPPTPEEVAAFLNDESPDAWEQQVDRLLASPRYGERWARHWMDLVHFAETHGHDQDRPREHAWPYRDYLIHSFNQDKTYSEFVKEQIAGDVFAPFDPEALTATGFLSAGPWDESSLLNIREDSIDRLKAQYLDRDDIVTTVMSTFNSTSLHCARCHDHKFDPITQEDYYEMQAVFAGIDKANRSYDSDSQTALQRKELTERKSELEKTFTTNPTELLTDDNLTRLSEWENSNQHKPVLWKPLSMIDFHSDEDATLQLQEDQSILVTGMKPETDIYHLTATTRVDTVTAVKLEVLPHEALPSRGPGRAENGNLHLNEVHLFTAKGTEQPEQELPISDPFADFNQEGWGIDKAVDGNPDTAWGIHPAEGQSHFAVFPLTDPVDGSANQLLRLELHQTHGRSHLIGCFRVSVTDAPVEQIKKQESIPFEITEILLQEQSKRTPEDQARLVHWHLSNDLEAEFATLPSLQMVYSGTNQFEIEGSFKPATTPRDIHVLHRGQVTEPRELASPGSLDCLESLSGEIAISSPNQEAARREGLAFWLADKENPLTWRSIANRVWLYHFGQGLVTTPNDFGQMGASPTHPELLDWLATTMREEGSLKSLHRLILTSAVYQQQSTSRTEAAEVDSGNQLLWRMNRRRLDAESYRDALLLISGSLDSKMGGPSVRQFIETKGVHVTPNVDYLNFDVNDPANYRRSVYRFLFRTIPDPFMESLDCPDASQLTPKRNVSLTAIQALATLNDKFVIRQSELLADDLQLLTELPEEQIQQAWRRLFQRDPNPEELAAVLEYTHQHGLANTCRFLLNTNEFLFVD
ncbi:DUF1553 domain-containing protein [Polystyrenella longa]|uniref:DUF1553 domain-containing protein n=1 Tax=Polystyrenella longa TaxID=2528007 RepID=UPI0018D2158A|nr:PSD1 and planctomycete cytochrome C domain-containing protein [Polystyrenella longa]